MSKEAAVLAEDYLVELHQLSEERDALRSKLDLAVKALGAFSDIGAWMFNGSVMQIRQISAGRTSPAPRSPLSRRASKMAVTISDEQITDGCALPSRERSTTKGRERDVLPSFDVGGDRGSLPLIAAAQIEACAAVAKKTVAYYRVDGETLATIPRPRTDRRCYPRAQGEIKCQTTGLVPKAMRRRSSIIFSAFPTAAPYTPYPTPTMAAGAHIGREPTHWPIASNGAKIGCTCVVSPSMKTCSRPFALPRTSLDRAEAERLAWHEENLIKKAAERAKASAAAQAVDDNIARLLGL